MGAPDLVFELRSSGYSIVADGSYLDISPADDLSPELVKQLKQRKAEILTELQRESRQKKVLAMLSENPNKQRAVYADTESDQGNVILAIAVRNLSTYEMLIPKAKYDPFLLLSLVDNTGRIH